MNDFPYDGEHEHQEHEDIAHMPEDERHPFWASERIELKSVGVDIGTFTTHLMFSELVLRRLGLFLSSRFQVVERKISHGSKILLSPYASGNTMMWRPCF